ncbi:MAG: sugar ABC transporter ATP-binding protein [Actinomycetia bacterium]|nr:sugar ABC transporter ATP-binding protein [Actinomycetes bacterium]
MKSAVADHLDGEMQTPSPVPYLEAISISKTFGHVTALSRTSIALHGGEIVALVGDNGAGKSTLVAILSGVLQADEGIIRVAGKEVTIDSAQTAIGHGIATVFQGLALVEQRSVAANLHLGREPTRFGVFVQRHKMMRSAREVIAELGVNLPSVRAAVRDLSGGQRQSVAVSRAILRGGKAMLMDEPTAALGIREAGHVYSLMRQMRLDGHAVLVVSHNLESVFDIADRIVVLRHGRVIANKAVSEVTRDVIVGLIVGSRKTDR